MLIGVGQRRLQSEGAPETQGRASTEAPSGATGYAPLFPSDHGMPSGDLNSPYPTVREQADCAAVGYPSAEIVVINGCLNEVGPEEVALPPPLDLTSKEAIEQRAYQYCSTPMQEILAKVKAAFPWATIIVANYYQIVSNDSSILRLEANRTSPSGLLGEGSSENERK